MRCVMVSRTSAIASGIPGRVCRRLSTSGSLTTSPSCWTSTAMIDGAGVWAEAVPEFKMQNARCRHGMSRTNEVYAVEPFTPLWYHMLFEFRILNFALLRRSERMPHSDVERVRLVFITRQNPREAVGLIVLEQDNLIAGGGREASRVRQVDLL